MLEGLSKPKFLPVNMKPSRGASSWTFFWRSISLVTFILCTSCSGKEEVAYQEYTSLVETHEEASFGNFVEPDFPFISTALNLSDSTTSSSRRNIAIRSLIIDLGNESSLAFDTDLVRMAGIFPSKTLHLGSMAHVSYNDFGNKKNAIPWLDTTPLFSTGIYPGVAGKENIFADPRPDPPNVEEVGRGPIPASIGKWKGLHLVDKQVILSYVAGKTPILEMPSSSKKEGDLIFHRSFSADASPESIAIQLADFGDIDQIELERYSASGLNRSGDAFSISVHPEPINGSLELHANRYLTLELEGPAPPTAFTVSYSKDKHDLLPSISLPSLQNTDRRWNHKVFTRGILDSTSTEIAVDEIKLPVDNPWKRNVRTAGIDFFNDGRAAVSTYDGDIWIVEGIDADLSRLEWTRFASGLSEPMSLVIVNDEVYTYGRDGIVNPRDTNGNGEADFYKSYSLWPAASIESRAFALDMHAHPDGGFIVGTGAATTAGPNTSPGIMEGFRAGGLHDGTVTHVFADGDSVAILASGLREPFLGVHPVTGLITASDQQGNSVPSTPIYEIRKGAYYGVPAMNKGVSNTPENPITWVPHTYDRSAVSQEWAMSSELGPINNQLINISYGEPAIYQIYIDDNYDGTQGGIVRLPATFPSALLKASINPQDELLYFAGFRIWDSNATTVSALSRIRVLAEVLNQVDSFSIDKRGILLSFPFEIDPESVDSSSVAIAQWDYLRSDKYGSPRVNPRRAATMNVQVSSDKRSVFATLANFDQAWQTEISYALKSVDGQSYSNTFYASAFEKKQLDLASYDFPQEILFDSTLVNRASNEVQAAIPDETLITVEDGLVILNKFGCQVCHSLDGSTEGKTGPSFKGLIGSTRTFTDGTSTVANREYIRSSIYEPGKQVVDGYSVGMAPYQGVISETEVISIFKYIRSLK